MPSSVVVVAEVRRGSRSRSVIGGARRASMVARTAVAVGKSDRSAAVKVTSGVDWQAPASDNPNSNRVAELRAH